MTRLIAVLLCAAAGASAQPATVFVLPNTHGTVSGWLVDFDTERNYVLNNYLAHLARVKSDASYSLAISEVPNVISLLQFAPERVPEVKQLLAQKRVELANGFFLEPDINLSGGEALVSVGTLGLRWYDDVFGMRPRHCWMIDITGAHRQFPQIVAGLGMESVFFVRNNPTRSTAFWWVAPDASRTLALVNKSYGEFGKDSIFGSREPLTDQQFAELRKAVEAKRDRTPGHTALFALGGSGDYSAPPLREQYPAEFLREWIRRYSDVKFRFSTPGEYVDALKQEIAAGRTNPPEYFGDTAYSWNSFWLNMPEVRQYYRRDEHLLQAAELLATAASLRGKLSYPAQEMYHSWIDMLMNMDRNTIWGASAGMVFRDPRHWDAWDRFESVERRTKASLADSARALAGSGSAATLVNALNWKRNDPVNLQIPAGQVLEGVACESLSGAPERVVCRPSLPAAGVASFRLKAGTAPAGENVALPETIETPYYVARVDPASGALTSLKVKPANEELLGGPANVIVADTATGSKADATHFMNPKAERRLVGTSAKFPAAVRVVRGPLATEVLATSDFIGGSKIERRMIFYRDHPRIDCDTRLDLKVNDVLVAVDFPLAADVVNRSRGIPYGFSTVDPRSGQGFGILPSIRWSSYELASGAGLALLDRGLTGHELTGRTVTLALVNAVSKYLKYPNEMLAGQGVREFSYALVPYTGTWQNAGIARMAWEFNAPPEVIAGTGVVKTQAFLTTSPNIIVEAVRRVGRQIEIRLVEAHGDAGTAELNVQLRHRRAALTNMMGEKPQALPGGPVYRFPVRPQQIVTVRLDTDKPVAVPAALREWSPLVPPAKRKALGERILKSGHPW